MLDTNVFLAALLAPEHLPPEDIHRAGPGSLPAYLLTTDGVLSRYSEWVIQLTLKS